MTKSYTVEADGFTGNYHGEELVLKSINLPDARTINGNQFPYALGLENERVNLDNAVEFLVDLATDGHLTKLINKHGALLIRGLGDPSPEAFSKIVTQVETARGLKPFQQIGLAGKRNIKAPNVFTANEGPKSKRFYQHNEYSRYTHYPRCIHFFSNKAAKSGGASPIASSVEFYQKLYEASPEVVKEISRKNIKTSQLYPSRYGKINFKGNEFHWEDQDGFGQLIEEGDSREEQKRKAEIMIKKLTDDFVWNEDGSVTISQYTPAFRLHPDLKVPVSFNNLPGRYGTIKSEEATDPPFIGNDGGYYPPLKFGDDTNIPNNILDKFLEISRDIEYNHYWQEGDVLFVDNYQTSHGRQPWTDGERVVLVSMWDQDNVEFEPYVL